MSREMRFIASIVLLSACAAKPVAPEPAAPEPVSPEQEVEEPMPELREQECVQIEPEPRRSVVWIHEVYMVEDCRDRRGGTRTTIKKGRRTRPCIQSHVILMIDRSEVEWQFGVERARVLDAATLRPLASVRLREPRLWLSQEVLVPWDGRVDTKPLIARFDVDEPDLSEWTRALGPDDDPRGPLVLELDVWLEGVRTTIRSPAFMNHDADAPGALADDGSFPPG